MTAATFTVVGASTGRPFAVGVALAAAAGWMVNYGGVEEDLRALEVGETWRSNDAALGIRVTRVS